MTTMKIYYGKAEPLTAVGRHQVKLLQWLEYRYHNGDKNWVALSSDRTTKRAINGLIKRGSIQYNELLHAAKIAYSH